MAELKRQDSGVNWAVVGFGVILLALAVASIPDDKIFLRVIAAAVIMLVTFYWSHSRQEPEVENPLLDQLHTQQHGLDRRKYGRLRSSTEMLLEYIRQMNRVAVEGREGKLAPRHTQAELDRLAAKLRDAVDDIRKAAGVPTPLEKPGPKGAQPKQPQVVIPKARTSPDVHTPNSDPPRKPDPEPPREFYDEADATLDDLVAKAEAEAEARSSEREREPKPATPPDEQGNQGKRPS